MTRDRIVALGFHNVWRYSKPTFSLPLRPTPLLGGGFSLRRNLPLPCLLNDPTASADRLRPVHLRRHRAAPISELITALLSRVAASSNSWLSLHPFLLFSTDAVSELLDLVTASRGPTETVALPTRCPSTAAPQRRFGRKGQLALGSSGISPLTPQLIPADFFNIPSRFGPPLSSPKLHPGLWGAAFQGLFAAARLFSCLPMDSQQFGKGCPIRESPESMVIFQLPEGIFVDYSPFLVSGCLRVLMGPVRDPPGWPTGVLGVDLVVPTGWSDGSGCWIFSFPLYILYDDIFVCKRVKGDSCIKAVRQRAKLDPLPQRSLRWSGTPGERADFHTTVMLRSIN
nr:hypothetical protein LSAT_6X94260 [Ipomoea batatas]